MHDVQFSNESKASRFDITGSGGAHEVFSNVLAAIVAYVKKEDPSIITFSASEPSRRRLYDRMVKTVSKIMPQYAAIYSESEGYRKYVVIERDMKDEAIRWLEEKTGETPTILVNQFQELTPVISFLWDSSLLCNAFQPANGSSRADQFAVNNTVYHTRMPLRQGTPLEHILGD